MSLWEALQDTLILTHTPRGCVPFTPFLRPRQASPPRHCVRTSRAGDHHPKATLSRLYSQKMKPTHCPRGTSSPNASVSLGKPHSSGRIVSQPTVTFFRKLHWSPRTAHLQALHMTGPRSPPLCRGARGQVEGPGNLAPCGRGSGRCLRLAPVLCSNVSLCPERRL